jgi:hypothetical protein
VGELPKVVVEYTTHIRLLGKKIQRVRSPPMTHGPRVWCLAALVAVAIGVEQEPPSQRHDADNQHHERRRHHTTPLRPRSRPQVQRPMVLRWARPANVANGAVLLMSGAPVALRSGLLNVQPIGLLLGGWVGEPGSNRALRALTLARP